MTQNNERAGVQLVLGDEPRVAGRDYIEIGQLHVYDLKTALALLPQPVVDGLVIQKAAAFRTEYGFAADHSDEQRRQVVEIKNRTGYAEYLIRRLKWAGALRLTERGAHLSPSYLSEAVGCFQSLSFLLFFLVTVTLLIGQPTQSIERLPAQVLFISSQLGFAVLSYWGIFQPSRIARRGLQLLLH